MVKRDICLLRIDAFMRLIQNEHIPVDIRDFIQFIVFTAEVGRAFQILQRNEFNASPRGKVNPLDVFRPCHAILFILNCIHVADEHDSVFRSDKLDVVIVPGVRDCRTIGEDQNVARIDSFAEIIHGQGLPEPRFRVPQKRTVFMRVEILDRIGNGLFLLFAKIIRNGGADRFQNTAVLLKLIKLALCFLGADSDEFGLRLFFITQFIEISPKIMIGEHFPGTVVIDGKAFPLQFCCGIGGVRLLLDPIFNCLLFRIADFRPAVMRMVIRRCVRIDHWNDSLTGSDEFGDIL